MVASYDVDTAKVCLFKTPHHPSYRRHAAPPRPWRRRWRPRRRRRSSPRTRSPGRGTFIDGGLWANCPAMVGVVEALDFLGRSPEDVRMLSLSTTSYPFRLENPAQLRGPLGWAPKLVDTFKFGQAQAAVNQAFCLLKRGLSHRFDYLAPPKTFRMDNAKCVQELIGMGRSIAELDENMNVVKEMFLDGGPAEPFPS